MALDLGFDEMVGVATDEALAELPSNCRAPNKTANRQQATLLRGLAGFQQLPDLLLRGVIEAAARLSHVDQPSAFIEPEHNRAKVLA